MAAATVSTILLQLAAITAGNAGKAWRLVTVAEQEVHRLQGNFTVIRGVLADAEVKQYRDRDLKQWLERFKQVSYDMEDALDDWRGAIQELQTADHDVETNTICFPKWKVCEPFVSCFSFCSQIVKRLEIATRIKNIDNILRRIVNDQENLNFTRGENIEQSTEQESTTFVDVSTLLGREDVQKVVIKTLWSEPSEKGSCIPTITIVGMRGIGKTALAQLIYHESKSRNDLDKRIWVCASKFSNEKQIARAIVDDLGRNLSNETSLQTLLRNIQEEIEGKKFFLVLDDVRADHHTDWKQLIYAFKYGKFGSRILVTTCQQRVASKIKSFRVFLLRGLRDEICWKILSQKAFPGKNEMHFKSLEGIGREIVKKCHGLPLVAETLGSILQDKLRRDEWENVLNSRIWESDLITEPIYAPFLLSYSDLPPATRKCLLYCAIFPNDAIGKDELIQHWMAQGYWNPDDNLGENHFRCLATHFFLQDFRKDEHGNIISCKMNNVVHDFVRFLTKCEFVTGEIVEGLPLNLSSKKPRHLRLVIGKCSSSPLSIDGTEKLHSLVAVSHGKDGTISDEALQKLFSRSKHLRLLKFDSIDLNLKEKEIARGIGNLIHLRCLSLIDCSGIESLPEVVCELLNLQSLNLRRCWSFKKLPVGIGNLINLRYLCIEDCPSLSYYPKGISKLTSLRRLSDIKMRADCNDAEEFSIGDLKNLNLLRGNLCVELTGDSIDSNEAKRAKLGDKKDLKQIKIWTRSQRIKRKDVLQALELPSTFPVKFITGVMPCLKWPMLMVLGKVKAQPVGLSESWDNATE